VARRISLSRILAETLGPEAAEGVLSAAKTLLGAGPRNPVPVRTAPGDFELFFKRLSAGSKGAVLMAPSPLPSAARGDWSIWRPGRLGLVVDRETLSPLRVVPVLGEGSNLAMAWADMLAVSGGARRARENVLAASEGHNPETLSPLLEKGFPVVFPVPPDSPLHHEAVEGPEDPGRELLVGRGETWRLGSRTVGEKRLGAVLFSNLSREPMVQKDLRETMELMRQRALAEPDRHGADRRFRRLFAIEGGEGGLPPRILLKGEFLSGLAAPSWTVLLTNFEASAAEVFGIWSAKRLLETALAGVLDAMSRGSPPPGLERTGDKLMAMTVALALADEVERILDGRGLAPEYDFRRLSAELGPVGRTTLGGRVVQSPLSKAQRALWRAFRLPARGGR
jgi:hypothetical protein